MTVQEFREKLRPEIKLGDGETFWDYKSEDNSYLSLGIEDKTSEQMDFYGRIVDNDLVKIYGSAN